MSKNNSCNKRFKGVENFLRRVAYNLGNTPSQTEVKIISCIPIDVTDLQQKIIQLERQLEDRNQVPVTAAPAAHAAVYNLPSATRYCDAACSYKKNSCRTSSSTTLDHNNRSVAAKPTKTSVEPEECRSCSYMCPEYKEMSNAKVHKRAEISKPLFTEKRKLPKKKKCKTQMIYYAQPEVNSPFSNNGLGDDWSSKNRGRVESFDTSYVSGIVRKQYKPVIERISVSEFSTPICRDIPTQKVPEHRPYESDMCSCCHGPFKNIDNHMSKHNFDLFLSRNNSYYDSNLYDVVPVKENAIKVKNVAKNQIDMSCWPENPYCSYKVPPIIVNYHTIGPTRPHIARKAVKLVSRKEKVLSKMAKNKPVICKAVKPLIKTRSVEFGEVYAKRFKKTRQKISKTITENVTKFNDAACLTVISSREFQTKLVSNTHLQQDKKDITQNLTLSEDKTEVTLNQIKEILQSVLAEVKTNSKIGNIPEQGKKDAVVQNGPSHSNIYGGSSLLQSFTYSPYNIDPYSASCSRHIETGNFCHQNIPNGQIKCMQHYPLFVQQGRNMCISCYKNNPQVQLPTMNRAASAATNTEQFQIRGTETENLIKEIYRSMALNIEIPSLDKPVKEHGNKNEVIPKYNIKTDAQRVTKDLSEIFKNTKTIETLVTRPRNEQEQNDTASQIKPERNSSQSTRKESVSYYSNGKKSETDDDNDAEQISQPLESDEESDDTIVNQYKSESSETETENEELEILKPEKKEEKKGLFSKMLKIFKPSTRILGKATKGSKADQSDSDSDDYQTVYSHKVASPKPTHKAIKSKAHSKVFYTKQPQQKPRNQSPSRNPRRSPYMEQEYRRYFDEKLMFHDKRDPRSSTRSTSYQKRPVYYENFQTKSARVDPYTQPSAYEKTQNFQTNFMQQSKNQSYVQGKMDLPARSLIVHPKAMAWLKKHKIGIHCGEQWKNFILDN